MLRNIPGSCSTEAKKLFEGVHLLEKVHLGTWIVADKSNQLHISNERLEVLSFTLIRMKFFNEADLVANRRSAS